MLLDKSTGTHVNHTIFALPNKSGKGVLVTQTVHGNLLIGPTATDLEDREETATTSEGMETVSIKSGKTVKDIPLRKVITSFAGLRAVEDGMDFCDQRGGGCTWIYRLCRNRIPGTYQLTGHWLYGC